VGSVLFGQRLGGSAKLVDLNQQQPEKPAMV
jgi:hypothetical protein